ncbi:unnamed protein product [Nesidiocoris tenuis]|uniref:Uncharacterized protein n=1 Tax=Nesidiocoris tenuis TaxID=355587 RepID=A0A6H5FXG7_9HEMI|nr:unnamed protein product [Nesidiocoris tenuis]
MRDLPQNVQQRRRAEPSHGVGPLDGQKPRLHLPHLQQRVPPAARIGAPLFDAHRLQALLLRNMRQSVRQARQIDAAHEDARHRARPTRQRPLDMRRLHEELLFEAQSVATFAHAYQLQALSVRSVRGCVLAERQARQAYTNSAYDIKEP